MIRSSILAVGIVLPMAASAFEIEMKPSFGWASDEAAGMSVEMEALDYDEKPIQTLASQTSFPLRLVFGPYQRDNWEGLPDTATHPTALVRRYAARGCHFSVEAGTYTVRMLRTGPAGALEV